MSWILLLALMIYPVQLGFINRGAKKKSYHPKAYCYVKQNTLTCP